VRQVLAGIPKQLLRVIQNAEFRIQTLKNAEERARSAFCILNSALQVAFFSNSDPGWTSLEADIKICPMTRGDMSRRVTWVIAAILAAVPAGVGLVAQGAGQAQQPGAGRGAAAPQAPATPQAVAPIDLTGYWVSIVNEDWRWRMVTPPKGDTASVPLNPEGTKVAGSWDPATDGSCLAYGPTAHHVGRRSGAQG
jgi:hypothetical protein